MNDEQPATPQRLAAEVKRLADRYGGLCWEQGRNESDAPTGDDVLGAEALLEAAIDKLAATPQQPAAASAGTAHAALAELVAVKDLKDRTEAIGFAGPSGTLGEDWQATYDSGRKEYLRRQPLAWDAARAALQSPPVATTQQSEAPK